MPTVMRRMLLFIAVAGAVAYATAAVRTRRAERFQDQKALSTWEGEGGSPLPDGAA